MMTSPFRALATALLLAAGVVGCSEKHATEASDSAQRAVSPLVGSWHIAGEAPGSSGKLPNFTKLRFEQDGALAASYVAGATNVKSLAGGTGGTKDENDTYTIVPPKTVRITEGSRALDYTFDVHDEKLYLTPPGETAATVFAKVSAPE